MTPKVSVVIPVFNGEQYVRQAVESVVAQGYPDCEIVVADDGSTDRTREVLTPYAGCIRYSRQPNAGCAAARNRGIREARGRYIAFQDHDDVWLADKLAIQIPFLEQDPALGLVYADMANLEPDGRVGPPRLQAHDVRRLSGRVFDYLLQWWIIACPTVVVRREVFERVGYFDESFRGPCSDWEMWLRIAREYPVAYVERVLAYCRRHETNLTKRSGTLGLVKQQRRVLDETFAAPGTTGSARCVRRRAYAHIYYKAGRDLVAEGHRREAAGLLLKAFAWDPSFGRPLVALGKLCLGPRVRARAAEWRALRRGRGIHRSEAA